MLDLLICPACGDRAERPVVREGTLVCAECLHTREFRRPPVFCLTGPSGAGKSTVGPMLVEHLRGRALVLEQDVLWVPGLRDPEDEHRDFRTLWLRLLAMIGQNGLPVVLCGTVVPPELEHRPERALLGDVHYLALVCDDEVLRARLSARPAWRGWDDERIAEMLEFAAWLRANAATQCPPVTLLDTTDVPLADTVRAVTAWIDGRLRDRDSRTFGGY